MAPQVARGAKARQVDSELLTHVEHYLARVIGRAGRRHGCLAGAPGLSLTEYCMPVILLVRGLRGWGGMHGCW